MDAIQGQAGRPVPHSLTRLVYQRGLALILLIAFLNAAFEFNPLLGEHGLLPAPLFTKAVPFSASPSLFFFAPNDTAFTIAAPAGAAAAPALAVPKDGKSLFEAVCSSCHSTGLAGAPKAGDKSVWGPRIAQGKATLYQHALNGYNGKAGIMPAKGGRTDLPDDLIKQGVDYLVSLAQ